MKFSFIITTQGDRVTDFERFLNSVIGMDYEDYEIILVDQSDSNIIEEMVESAINGNKITYLKVSKMALSKARNIGLKYVTGDIFAFPDDDCWYSNNIISDVSSYLTVNKEIDILCCNVYDPNEKKFYGKRRKFHSEIININQINIFKFPISVGIFIRNSKSTTLAFDEQLGAGSRWGSGEETDLLLRLLKMGYRIIYNSKLLIFHPIGNSDNWNLNKYKTYGMGFGATIKKAIRRGQYWVTFELLEIIIRTMGGILLKYISDNKSAKKYFVRIKGIFLGLIKA